MANETLQLTLPNGATRDVAPGTLARDVVASIGPGLLKAAVAVAVDGAVQDLMTPIRKGGAFVVLKESDPRAVMERLMADRYPIYAEADITIETGNGPHNNAVGLILDALRVHLAKAE